MAQRPIWAPKPPRTPAFTELAVARRDVAKQSTARRANAERANAERANAERASVIQGIAKRAITSLRLSKTSHPRVEASATAPVVSLAQALGLGEELAELDAALERAGVDDREN